MERKSKESKRDYATERMNEMSKLLESFRGASNALVNTRKASTAYKEALSSSRNALPRTSFTPKEKSAYERNSDDKVQSKKFLD
ncbi:hypothetical protein [Cohnella terricola]|uniref:Uncharacterized protein n=1 Tax=Cohnella terricola TaxID=1289167 RepID=A0A559JL72_9BACL|nr:hypothetical protein [Cohnella terricola]TVY00626.1 hypothetical protein FPZ45_11480 [Cohnella terricola]